jgi:DNA invertase Pin-like site-specific DNA recombinase
MAAGRFVSYIRVSTQKQGRSGLGLEGQREAVASYLNGGPWQLLEEFVEVESGRKSDRPQLAAALNLCRMTNSTLVIAKLDRLARDAHFLLGLQKAGVEFIAADMPAANRLTVGIMALVAEEEARMISARTRAALAAAKTRGKQLGGFRGYVPDGAAGTRALQAKADSFAAQVGPMAQEMRGQGLSLAKIAATLAEKGIRTAGGGTWTAGAVRNLLARLPA